MQPTELERGSALLLGTPRRLATGALTERPGGGGEEASGTNGCSGAADPDSVRAVILLPRCPGSLISALTAPESQLRAGVGGWGYSAVSASLRTPSAAELIQPRCRKGGASREVARGPEEASGRG